MLDAPKSLPEDHVELRVFTTLLLAEVKSQAVLIEKLHHQLAGHRAHRFWASSETSEQLQLALEMSEIAIAAMTAQLRPPEDAPADKPKRRPIPDHIPRMEVELTPGSADCEQCGGKLRRLGEDVAEELEYVPVRFIVNRIVRPRFEVRAEIESQKKAALLRDARLASVKSDRVAPSSAATHHSLTLQRFGRSAAVRRCSNSSK